MAKKKYSLVEKIKYYTARATDTALTKGQRDYANSFLDSVGQKALLKSDDYSISEIQLKIAACKKEIKAAQLLRNNVSDVYRGLFAGEIAVWENLLKEKGG